MTPVSKIFVLKKTWIKSILLPLSCSSEMTYGEVSTLTISCTDRWFHYVIEKIKIISLNIYIESLQLRILSFTLDMIFHQLFRRLKSWMQSMINFDRHVKIISFELYNDTQVNSWSWKLCLLFLDSRSIKISRTKDHTVVFEYWIYIIQISDLKILSSIRQEKTINRTALSFQFLFYNGSVNNQSDDNDNFKLNIMNWNHIVKYIITFGRTQFVIIVNKYYNNVFFIKNYTRRSNFSSSIDKHSFTNISRNVIHWNEKLTRQISSKKFKQK